MTTITATADSAALKAYMAGEATAVFSGARAAVKRQTEETKNEARAVVNLGLTGSRLNRGGNRRVAQTIRSSDYPDSPAGFVHSTWGYFAGGGFVDILATHEQGKTIVPRAGKRMLFIPFVGGARRRRLSRSGLQGDKVDLIPTRDGLLVVTRAGKGRTGLVLGLLTRRVRIPKRLDFRTVEQRAETGLVEKTIVEIEIASQRSARQ